MGKVHRKKSKKKLVQYIFDFEERHRSMKENCLWGRCKKSKRELTIQHFGYTYIHKTNTC